MSVVLAREVIFGLGHENIQATHRSTIEFTKDDKLSRSGDCVLAVSIDKGLVDLSRKFREAMRKPGAKLTIQIDAADFSERIQAYGNPHLELSNSREIVIRKSDFTSGRTLAVNADKAAIDVSRELVSMLHNPEQIVKITLTVRS